LGRSNIVQRASTTDRCQALYDSSVAISPAKPDTIGWDIWKEIHYDQGVTYIPTGQFFWEMEDLAKKTKTRRGLHILSAESYSKQDEDEAFKKFESAPVYALFGRTWYATSMCSFDSEYPVTIIFHHTIKRYVQQGNKYLSDSGFNLTLDHTEFFTRIVAHELCHQLSLDHLDVSPGRCCHDDGYDVLCECVLCGGEEFLGPMVMASSEWENINAIRYLLAKSTDSSYRWPCVCERHRNMLRTVCSLDDLKNQFPDN
jgi:hypothetical protein